MIGCFARRKIAWIIPTCRAQQRPGITSFIFYGITSKHLHQANFRRMTTQHFIFDPFPVSSVPVVTNEDPSPFSSSSPPKKRFPVHRIYCVGRNYSDHVQEMGGDPKKSAPTFFTKPADAVVESPATIAYPMATQNLHYEVELVVCIGKSGSQINVDNALSHVFGYAVGIDLTRRDLQSAAKSKGLPWDSAKAFDQSAPIGAIVPAGSSDAPLHTAMESAPIQLTVNHEIRQNATLNQMIWSTKEIIHQLSKLFHLEPGDLIFTGTPSGVGPISPGDTVVASVEGLPKLELHLMADGSN